GGRPKAAARSRPCRARALRRYRVHCEVGDARPAGVADGGREAELKQGMAADKKNCPDWRAGLLPGQERTSCSTRKAAVNVLPVMNSVSLIRLRRLLRLIGRTWRDELN